MFIHTQKALIVLIVILVGAVWSQAQSTLPPCPIGLICLTQEQANVAAQNARENPLLKEKIAVLETALIEKDKNTDALKVTNDANLADLKRAIHETEVKLATQTGENIQLKAMLNMMVTILDAAIKNTRKKSIGIIAM